MPGMFAAPTTPAEVKAAENARKRVKTYCQEEKISIAAFGRLIGSNESGLSRFMRGACGKRSNVYPAIMKFLKRSRCAPQLRKEEKPKATIPSKPNEEGRSSTSSITSNGSLASSLPAATMCAKVEAEAVDPTSAKS